MEGHNLHIFSWNTIQNYHKLFLIRKTFSQGHGHSLTSKHWRLSNFVAVKKLIDSTESYDQKITSKHSECSRNAWLSSNIVNNMARDKKPRGLLFVKRMMNLYLICIMIHIWMAFNFLTSVHWTSRITQSKVNSRVQVPVWRRG